MSNDNRYWMSLGFRVQHRYGRRSNTCVRCATRRRFRNGGWEWRTGQMFWSHLNPVCRKREDAVPR